MSIYLITTPSNPDFDGKLFGLRFSHGRAVLTEDTLDPNLGHTVDGILKDLKDFPGYQVRTLSAKAARALEELELEDGTKETDTEVDETGGRGQVSKAKKKAKGEGK